MCKKNNTSSNDIFAVNYSKMYQLIASADNTKMSTCTRHDKAGPKVKLPRMRSRARMWLKTLTHEQVEQVLGQKMRWIYDYFTRKISLQIKSNCSIAGIIWYRFMKRDRSIHCRPNPRVARPNRAVHRTRK